MERPTSKIKTPLTTQTITLTEDVVTSIGAKESGDEVALPLREARHLIAIGRAMEKTSKRKSTGGQKAKAKRNGETRKPAPVTPTPGKRAVKTSPDKE